MTAPTSHEELLAKLAGHVTRFNQCLADNGWTPRRSHIEGARNALEDAAKALRDDAQGAMVPAAWQYRVMFDARHERRDEWCPWRDAGEKYFNKVNAEIAAGATRVQTRILYALPSTGRGEEK